MNVVMHMQLPPPPSPLTRHWQLYLTFALLRYPSIAGKALSLGSVLCSAIIVTEVVC